MPQLKDESQVGMTNSPVVFTRPSIPLKVGEFYPYVDLCMDINGKNYPERDKDGLVKRHFSHNLPQNRIDFRANNEGSKRKALSSSVDFGRVCTKCHKCKNCSSIRDSVSMNRNSRTRPVTRSGVQSGQVTPAWPDYLGPRIPNRSFSSIQQCDINLSFPSSQLKSTATTPGIELDASHFLRLSLMKKASLTNTANESLLQSDTEGTYSSSPFVSYIQDQSSNFSIDSTASSKRPSECGEPVSTPQVAGAGFLQTLRITFNKIFPKASTSSVTSVGPQKVLAARNHSLHPIVTAAISVLADETNSFLGEQRQESSKLSTSVRPHSSFPLVSTLRQSVQDMTQVRKEHYTNLCGSTSSPTDSASSRYFNKNEMSNSRQTLNLDEEQETKLREKSKPSKLNLKRAPMPRSPEPLIGAERQFSQNMNFYRRHNSKNSRPSSEFSSPERYKSPVSPSMSIGSFIRTSKSTNFTAESTIAQHVCCKKCIEEANVKYENTLTHKSIDTLEASVDLSERFFMKKDISESIYKILRLKNPRYALSHLEDQTKDSSPVDFLAEIKKNFFVDKAQLTRKSFHSTKINQTKRTKLAKTKGIPFSQSCESQKTSNEFTSSPQAYEEKKDNLSPCVEEKSSSRKMMSVFSMPEGLDILFNELNDIESNETTNLAARNCDTLDIQIPNNSSQEESTHQFNPDTDYEFNIPYGDIRLKECIMKGAYKEIYRGLWHGEVVVHTFYNLTPAGRNKFWREVTKMTLVRHENIALFMGASMEPPKFAIVTSVTRGPCLFETIHKTCEKLSSNYKLNLLRQLTEALSYLHSKSKPIIVKKLNSRNIFLEPKLTLCLMDYSDLDCVYETTEFVHLPDVTSYYVAPELFRISAEIYKKGQSPYMKPEGRECSRNSSFLNKNSKEQDVEDSCSIKTKISALSSRVCSTRGFPSQTDSGLTQVFMRTASPSQGSYYKVLPQRITSNGLKQGRTLSMPSLSSFENNNKSIVDSRTSQSTPFLERQISDISRCHWGISRGSLEQDNDIYESSYIPKHAGTVQWIHLNMPEESIHQHQITPSNSTALSSSPYSPYPPSSAVSSDNETETQSENNYLTIPSSQLPSGVPRLAPESAFTLETDMYALGTIFYEIYANSYPMNNFDHITLIEEVTSDRKLSISQLKASSYIKKIIDKCWSKSPQCRPSIKEICNQLKDRVIIHKRKTNSVPSNLNRIGDVQGGFL